LGVAAAHSKRVFLGFPASAGGDGGGGGKAIGHHLIGVMARDGSAEAEIRDDTEDCIRDSAAETSRGAGGSGGIVSIDHIHGPKFVSPDLYRNPGDGNR